MRTLTGLIFLSILIITSTAQATYVPGKTAVLMGLDKSIGRMTKLSGTVGQSMSFGPLEITVRSCYETPENETPEKTAFLEIAENKYDPLTRASLEKEKIFTGWMFASSPSLSAMDHPRYDVWVLECQ